MMLFYHPTTMLVMLGTFGAAPVFVMSPVNSIILVDSGLDAFVMELRNLILSDSGAFAVAACMHM